MPRDPFWKRSSFGSFLYVGGIMAIRWLVGGTSPAEADWIELLGLLLMVLGFTQFRPTTRAGT